MQWKHSVEELSVFILGSWAQRQKRLKGTPLKGELNFIKWSREDGHNRVKMIQKRENLKMVLLPSILGDFMDH